ncbi:MAG: glycosyltransferase [Xenococcaceae cyanobacterium MO_188.B29]|nr:glycosyltransferase [Xenococcaceae cyanobacterium MO_188.B29]
MTKKVCITTLEFPPDIGGVGESAQRIAQMLINLGYEVHIAVFRAVFRKERQMAKDGEFRRSHYTTSERNGVKVHRLFPAVRSTSAKEQDYICDLHGLLQQIHKQYKFNLFHAFFINEMGFLTTLLAKENNVPVINSIRGADLHKHIFNPQQLGQIRWTLENSAWTTFVSRDLMHRARIIAPSIESRSSAFWNSIAPVNFDNLPTPTLVEKLRGTVIGSVGRFRDKKGLEFLFDACRNLKTESELTLLLVGDFVAKEKDYWQQELSNSGLTDNIIITGTVSREEALAYLPHMDIFAIPSLHDGCPNALLEAMFASRAIVGTRVDAIGEILQDRVDALLVNPYSSEELEIALRELIDRPDLRQQLGMTAWQKVSQLNPFVEQQNWEQVYRYVLGVPELSPVPIIV